MSVLRRAHVRYLTRRPGHLLLSVGGVALGVAVVVAMNLAIESARRAFRASAETVAGRATHHVAGGPGGLPDSVVAAIRREAGVRAVAPVVEGLARSPRLPGATLRVLGIDPFSEAPFRPWTSGAGPAWDAAGLVTTPGGVVLSAPTALEAGVRPGDTLPLVVDGRSLAAPVVGAIEPEGPEARAGLRDLLLMDVASAQVALGRIGRLSGIDLRLPEGREGEEAAAAVRRVLPAGARVERAGARADTYADMIRAFDTNLTALSLLALVFGAFLIYNAQTFSVVRRREAIGGLRALGLTRAEVLRGQCAEAACVGVAGSALGLLVGVRLGRGLLGMVVRTIDDLYFTLSVGEPALAPEVLAGGLALGVGATVLAALPPALEAASTPPRLARLRSIVEERARAGVRRTARAGLCLAAAGGALLLVPTRSVVAGFAALALTVLGLALLTPRATVWILAAIRPAATRAGGVVGSMAVRSVGAALSRTAPAVAALVVAVSVTVGLGVMIGSFRSTLARWLDATLRADVYVSSASSRGSGRLPPAVVEALRSHPRVAAATTYGGGEVAFGGSRVRVRAVELGGTAGVGFDLAEGRPAAALAALRDGEAALVSEPFAFRYGIGAGDTVSLPAPHGELRLPVAGVYFDYGSDRGVVTVDRAVYLRHYPDPGVASMGLFLAPGDDPLEAVRALERAVPDGAEVFLRPTAALRRASLDVFDRTFRITRVLRLLAFLVAFAGVLGALMALELERAGELALLRALGLTPGQLGGLVAAETALLGVIAGVLAVPVGLVLAAVMVFVVNRRSFGWTLRMEIGPDVAVQAVALALAGALVAGAYPAWRMARTPPAAALRNE